MFIEIRFPWIWFWYFGLRSRTLLSYLFFHIQKLFNKIFFSFFFYSVLKCLKFLYFLKYSYSGIVSLHSSLSFTSAIQRNCFLPRCHHFVSLCLFRIDFVLLPAKDVFYFPCRLFWESKDDSLKAHPLPIIQFTIDLDFSVKYNLLCFLLTVFWTLAGFYSFFLFGVLGAILKLQSLVWTVDNLSC